jgi:hypothetical protein
MSDHVVVNEFVFLGDHNHAVMGEKLAVPGGFDHLYFLKVTLCGEQALFEAKT